MTLERYLKDNGFYEIKHDEFQSENEYGIISNYISSFDLTANDILLLEKLGYKEDDFIE